MPQIYWSANALILTLFPLLAKLSKIYQSDSGLLLGYIQKLQILSPFMAAQILLVFEIRRFFMIFPFFPKNVDIKKNYRT